MSFDPTKLQPALDALQKPGELTTEYAAFKSAATMSKIVMVVGLLVFVGSMIAAAFGADTKVGEIVGASVAILSQFLKIVNTLGYTKSRTDVKTAASDAVQAVAASDATQAVAAAAVMGPPAPKAQ